MRYTMDMLTSRRVGRFKRLMPRTAASAACAVIVALGVTCDMPPSFGDEYRDSSTNFIAAHALAEPVDYTDDGSTIALDALALWDWAWRGQTGNTYQYMSAVDQGATGPGGSGAWLLEAVNLAVNPAFASGTTGWDIAGSATMTDSGSIHGSSLQVVTPSASDYLCIGGALFSDAATLPDSYSYTLAITASGTTGLKSLESGYVDLQSPSWSASGPTSLLINTISTVTTQALSFTNIGSGSFEFDDVSAIRTDVPATKWSMVLRLSPKDTSPSLAPGIYEFSLYVKRPSTHYFSTDATRGDDEHYASRFVTLRMTQTQTVGAEVQTQTIASSSFDLTALADPDVWNQLTLRMPTGSNFTFDEDTETQVIELSISPMDPSSPEAGAVLIAAPSLSFYIDGY